MTIKLRYIYLSIFTLVATSIYSSRFKALNSGGYRFNYEIISDSTVALIRGGENYDLKGDVSIDSYVYNKGEKYRVIEIGDSAFMNNHNLIKIELPNTITKIGTLMLYSCARLEKVNLENTLVKQIPKACIVGCSWLKEVYLPSTLEIIGEGAFAASRDLYYINLPNSLKEIHSQAFGGCPKLDNVIIPNSVYKIGSKAFYNCEGLKNIHLPKTLKTIEASTFFGCQSLENIKLPDSLKTIGVYAFDHCRKLKNVRLPKSLTSLGGYSFLDCSSLKEIIIPGSITILEEGVFENCDSLKSIILPNNLQSIGECAFNNCMLLDSIHIPKSVNKIGEAAFVYCTNLSNIQFSNPLLTLGEAAFLHTAWLSNKLIGKFIEHPESEAMHYRNISAGDPPIHSLSFKYYTGLRVFATYHYPENMDSLIIDSIATIEHGCTKIPEWAYFNSSVLQVVQIPSTVVEIGCYAFARCKNLHTLIIDAREPPSICDYIVDAKNAINVYVVDAKVEVYMKHELWGRMKIKPMSDLLKK